jgi:NAD(P)H-dependent FMN reductase
MINIMVLLGSSRPGRQGEKVANWINNDLGKRSDISLDFVDVRELQLPFYDEPKQISDLAGKFNHAAAAEWNVRVGRADGFIMITPEYNHGVSAILKNAIDYAWESWNYKPLSMVSYSSGPWGGVRAIEQLRLIAAGVWLIPLFKSVQIAHVQKAFDSENKPVDTTLNDRLDSLVSELLMMSQKLKS